jgi:hypothetical protein
MEMLKLIYQAFGARSIALLKEQSRIISQLGEVQV